MLITKECDYGLRIIRTLGDYNKRTVQAICDIENIPYKYAYKILKKLQKSGIVKNKRGPNGGYILDKSLSTFSMYDVINAVDQRLFLFECLRHGADCNRNKADDPCKMHMELARLQELLVTQMKSKSIEDVLLN